MFADLINRTLKCFSNKKNTANHTDLYDELIKEAKKYFNEKEVLLIKKAYLVANDLHRGQKRNSGEPYIIHPLYVSYFLLTELKLHWLPDTKDMAPEWNPIFQKHWVCRWR